MKFSDFKIGDEFLSAAGKKRWRCTDVGTRVVVAIWLNPESDQSWFDGPPYVVTESVFDEYGLGDCEPAPASAELWKELEERRHNPQLVPLEDAERAWGLRPQHQHVFVWTFMSVFYWGCVLATPPPWTVAALREQQMWALTIPLVVLPAVALYFWVQFFRERFRRK